jgi:hypothetical protein
MNKIDRFRGLLEVELENEVIVLKSLKVNDLFDLLLLNKQETNQFEFGVNMLIRVLYNSYETEPIELIEQFVISNYIELIEGIMIALEWTTKEKLAKLKTEKEVKVEKKDKQKGIAIFKAKLGAQVAAEEIEDKYITTCYVLMKEFKYTKEYILSMPATTFLLLIDEMNKQAEREKEEINKNKTMKK